METKNVKFVAYLRMKGIHPDHVEKIARGRGKYQYTSLTASEWEQHKKDFDRSDFLTYAQNLDAAVDMAY